LVKGFSLEFYGFSFVSFGKLTGLLSAVNGK